MRGSQSTITGTHNAGGELEFAETDHEIYGVISQSMVLVEVFC